MSSGGMDWAYRIAASQKLDPLGLAIVLHLGWRDAPSYRTDRGIAAALGQHRSAVRAATAKLAAKGLIVRRSGQWVAAETVAIVEQRPDAIRPDPAYSDDDQGGPTASPGHSQARATDRPGGGPLIGPQKGHSQAPMIKENFETSARESREAPPSAAQASPHDAACAASTQGPQATGQRKRAQAASVVLPSSVVRGPERQIAMRQEGQDSSAAPSRWAARAAALSPFLRSQVRAGQSVLVQGFGIVSASSREGFALQAALRDLESAP